MEEIKEETLSPEQEQTENEPALKKSFFSKIRLFSPWEILLSAVGAVMFLLASACFADFANENDGKFTFLAMIFAFVGFVGLALTVILWVKKGRPVINRYFLALILAVNFYTLNEFLLYVIPTDLADNGLHLRHIVKPYFPNVLVGVLLYYIFFFIAVAFIKNKIAVKVLLTLFSSFFAFYAVLHYYIIQFRGGPIRFSDIANITSAGEISDDYKFSLSFIVVFSVIEAVLVLAAMWIADISEMKKPLKTASIGAGTLAAMCVGFYFAAEGVYSYDINNRIMLLNFSMGEDIDTYQDVGGLLTFYYDGLKNRVIVPEGYSADKAKEILSQYKDTTPVPEKKPTIIAILNESFADIEHLGDIDATMDYMPNIRALDNCIKGYVTVSPYGGYTCNSEFEFLTGNSMYFLPSGSAAYTQFMDNDQQSMVSHLNGLGYNTIALTPCRIGLWKIGNAYERFGFDKCYFKDNVGFTNTKYVDGNVADITVYERVIKEFEKKKADESQFIWVTTMQNHAPYKEHITEPITLNSPKSDQAESYLNSIYEADRAVGELINYFKSVDDEVVIVFFGDHYPHIAGFYDDVLGENLNDLPIEEFCRSHQTPYFIWANYDIEDKEMQNISLNYLGGYVMDVCGLPKSDYMNFIRAKRDALPIISGFGYVDEKGNWHRRDDSADGDTEAMKDYRFVQYYKIFDEKSNK
ncbi:MAG: sulfatase-like hydrolase/transferase [Ruminococcus sp.]|nr:sulfatase-like hydrolase/transferase [Ruminococcus sp.]